MKTVAVVLERPEQLVLSTLALPEPADDEVVVDVEWSGISTGTEKLLWSGRMPAFPGMGYPLVPGYETVGRITASGTGTSDRIGERVFVPGARCFGDIRGLFGGAASRLVVAGARALPIDEEWGEKGVLLALAATARHAVCLPGARMPELVVGHGVLGRLIARVVVAMGAPAPVVWETNAERRAGALGYQVVDPATDDRRNYKSICDVSGDPAILDTLVSRLAPGGEVVLAGFYDQPLFFAFAPAFMREASFRIAAQWQEADLPAVRELAESGALSLDGLITHRSDAMQAPDAYRTAFGDPACLKMILDWRSCQ